MPSPGTTKIAILGEYSDTSATHGFTNDAIQHSAQALGARVEGCWIATSRIDAEILAPAVSTDYSGYLIAPGGPHKDRGATLRAIRHAREHKIPLLGTCGGFQHMVIEFARTVAGVGDAQHEEYEPGASRLIISKLACSLAGKRFSIQLQEGSLAHRAAGRRNLEEAYYCNFGVNPQFIPALVDAGLVISGTDADGEPRIIEIKDHPFFLGTLFVPQAQSSSDAPHPLVSAFITACLHVGQG